MSSSDYTFYDIQCKNTMRFPRAQIPHIDTKKCVVILFALVVLVVWMLTGCAAVNDELSIAIYLTQTQSSEQQKTLIAAVQKLAREFKREQLLVKYTLIHATGATGEELAQLARQQRYHLIVTNGRELGQQIYQIASQQPSQNFLVLDVAPTLLKQKIPNLRAIYFSYNEMGFLAGYLGGLLLKERATSPQFGIDAEVPIAFISTTTRPSEQLEPSVLFGSQTILPLANIQSHTLSPLYSEEQAQRLIQHLANQEIELIITIGDNISHIVAAASRYKMHIIALETLPIRRRSVYATINVQWEQIAYEEMRALAAAGSILGSVAQVGIRDGYLAISYPRWHYLRPLAEELYEQSWEIVNRLQKDELRLPSTIP